MYALRTAAMSPGSHLSPPAMSAAGVQNLCRVRCDNNVGEQRRRANRLVHPAHQRFAHNHAQHLTWKTTRGKPGWNDRYDLHVKTVSSFLLSLTSADLVHERSEPRF